MHDGGVKACFDSEVQNFEWISVRGKVPWRVLVWDGDPGEENYIFDIWVPKDGVVTCCHWGILLSFLYILDHRLVFGYIS